MISRSTILILSVGLLMLSLGAAQGGLSLPSIDLQQAISLASQRSNVQSAALELSDADLSADRTLSDPLALLLDKLQAEQRQQLALTSYQDALQGAEQEIVQAYTQVLDAEAQLLLSQKARDLNQQSLDIASIRFERGGATELDVKDARNDLEDSVKNLRSAEEGLQLAVNSLDSLIGLGPVELESVPAPTTQLPPLSEVLAAIVNLPSILQVRQGVELAQANVDLLDPSYASRSQIDAAQLQLDTAEQNLDEAKRGLEVQVRSLYNQAQTAANNRNVQLGALRNAQERLGLERQRLDSGLIAEITYKQSELASQQAQVTYLQAEHSYLLALFDLKVGSAYPLSIFESR